VRPRPELASRPSERKNRFFDSLGPGGVQTPKPSATDMRSKDATGGQELQIDSQDVYQFAHYGYVNCMLLGKGILPEAPSEEILVSGGGREEGESILSLALEANFLYSGRFDGEVNIWDLQTRQLVRSLKASTGDVSTLTFGGGALYAGGKLGRVQVCSQASFQSHRANMSRNSTSTTRPSRPSRRTKA
jgi:di- and tripeptidase